VAAARGSTPCRFTLTRATKVLANFVAGGSSAYPFPPGVTAPIDDMSGGIGWAMKVESVIPDATSQILAIGKNASCCQQRTGSQDYMIIVSVTPTGSALDLGALEANIYAKSTNPNSLIGVYTEANSGASGQLPPPHLYDFADPQRSSSTMARPRPEASASKLTRPT
jgi:hypothetical protein